MAVFWRTYRLKITINGTTKTYTNKNGKQDSLKISFNCSCNTEGLFSQGNVSIGGLSSNDLAFISTNYDFATGAIRNSELSLEVGYNGNLTLILQGNIIQAVPNFEANNELEMEVQTAAFNNLENSVNDSYNGEISLKELAQKNADNNKLALEFSDNVENKIIKNYSFNGTPFQQTENLRKYTNANVFINNNKLCVLDKKTSPYKNISISCDSGLLGTPKPTPLGCEFEMFLNPSLQVGSFVNLTSKKIPQLNGEFRIIELNHSGSNIDGNWVSSVVAYNREFA